MKVRKMAGGLKTIVLGGVLLCLGADAAHAVLDLVNIGTNTISHEPDSATGVPVFSTDVFALPSSPPLQHSSMHGLISALSESQGGLGSTTQEKAASIAITPDSFVLQSDPIDEYAGSSTLTFDFDATFEVTGSIAGDVNNDGKIDNLDVTPFGLALGIGGAVSDLANEQALRELVACASFAAADINEDKSVDNIDISPFIDLLAAGGLGATITNPKAVVDLAIAAVINGTGSASVDYEFNYTDPTTESPYVLPITGTETYTETTLDTINVESQFILGACSRLELGRQVRVHGNLVLSAQNDTDTVSVTLPEVNFVGFVPEPTSLLTFALWAVALLKRPRLPRCQGVPINPGA